MVDEDRAGICPVGGQAAEGGQNMEGEEGFSRQGDDTEVQLVDGVSGAFGLQDAALGDVVPADEAALCVHAPADVEGCWAVGYGQGFRASRWAKFHAATR